LRLGKTKSECEDRLRFFNEASTPESFRAFLSGLTFDFRVGKVRRNPGGKPNVTKETEMTTVAFLFAVTPFVRQVGPQLSHLEVFLPVEEDEEDDDENNRYDSDKRPNLKCIPHGYIGEIGEGLSKMDISVPMELEAQIADDEGGSVS